MKDWFRIENLRSRNVPLYTCCNKKDQQERGVNQTLHNFLLDYARHLQALDVSHLGSTIPISLPSPFLSVKQENLLLYKDLNSVWHIWIAKDFIPP